MFVRFLILIQFTSLFSVAFATETEGEEPPERRFHCIGNCYTKLIKKDKQAAGRYGKMWIDTIRPSKLEAQIELVNKCHALLPNGFLVETKGFGLTGAEKIYFEILDLYQNNGYTTTVHEVFASTNGITCLELDFGQKPSRGHVGVSDFDYFKKQLCLGRPNNCETQHRSFYEIKNN